MSDRWYGQNWQQDHGPVDHEVSHSGYMGLDANLSTFDEIENYKSNITQEFCQQQYANETEWMIKTYSGGFCPVSTDNLLCWPPTPYNTVAILKCFPVFYGVQYDATQNVTRECMQNGTWDKSAYDNCTELDVYPTNVETQAHIYLIGYILSSVTLAIAIFIFTYFKDLRCLRNKIHMNLMWSYLLTYCMWIIILIELNLRQHMAIYTCVFIVTLLHYFHITTFFWMFVEGLYLYILVVRTLTRESFKLRVYVVIGWGTPLIFIIVWSVFKSILQQPDVQEGCSWFQASKLDYIFQAPTIVVVLINIIFMISIMVVLVTKLRSANTLEIQQYRKAVKALAVLIPLLGVTYAITIYAPVLTMWDMLRSALLSIQGFMVALFYCFLNTEVQNHLKHHFENWKAKKSLGPSRLRSSSRSKDWSPRSRTESLRFTEWTLVAPEDLADLKKGPNQTPAGLMVHNLSNQRQSYQSSHRLTTDGYHHPCDVHRHSVELNHKDAYLNPASRESLYSNRKESLVHQPLIEQSEESPTDCDKQDTVVVMVNQKGDSMVMPKHSAYLKASL